MTLPTLASVSTLLRRFRYGDTLRPERDWLMMLALLLSLLALSVAWNTWFFLSVVADEESGRHPVEAADPIDRAMLSEERALLEAHALEEARYKTEYRFTDPGG